MSPHRLIPPTSPVRGVAELVGHVTRRLGTLIAGTIVAALSTYGVPEETAQQIAVGIIAVVGLLIDLAVVRLHARKNKLPSNEKDL